MVQVVWEVTRRAEGRLSSVWRGVGAEGRCGLGGQATRQEQGRSGV